MTDLRFKTYDVRFESHKSFRAIRAFVPLWPSDRKPLNAKLLNDRKPLNSEAPEPLTAKHLTCKP